MIEDRYEDMAAYGSFVCGVSGNSRQRRLIVRRWRRKGLLVRFYPFLNAKTFRVAYPKGIEPHQNMEVLK